MNAAVPEVLQPWLAEAMLAAGVVMLLLASRIPAFGRRAADIALIVVAASAVGAVVSMDALQGRFAGGTVVVDPFAAFFKFVLSMAAMAAVWLSTRARDETEPAGALPWVFFLASVLGMDLMVSAAHVVTAWAGLEIAGFGGALWIATRRDDASSARAALAMLIEGAAASATMLLGFALLFGLAGTFDFAGLAGRLSVSLAAPGGRPVIFAGTALVFLGAGLRLAVVPWHGSRARLAGRTSLPVSAWLQVGPALAVLAMLTRIARTALCDVTPDGEWTTLPGVEWPLLWSVVAAASMIAGSAAALGEPNLKRLLAWLSVAQAGYLLSGLVVLGDAGVEAVLFHAVAYALMTLGAMAAIAPLVEQAGSDDFEVLRGLARRRGGARVLAAALAVFVLSLSAVVPMAGYEGRTRLLAAVVGAGGSALALAAAAASFLGLLCCVRVVVTLLDRPNDADENVAMDFEVALLVGLLGAATVGLGLWPAPLASFVARSVVFYGG